MHNTILNLNHIKAKEFFLKSETYCNIGFPEYISFQDLLDRLSTEIGRTSIKNFSEKNISSSNINYTLYNNKDGRLSWRPLQLINPISYIDLVNEITKNKNWNYLKKRFKVFSKNKKIQCMSIPVVSSSNKSDKAEQILSWWENIEQESILQSLDYEYIFDTDISDCYGSIYTHSIAWATNGKKKAKNKRTGKSLLGNIIDTRIQWSQNGQTNGIPQGSVLMDFIAEIVLGYIDLILSIEIKKNSIIKYKILRYRDDYRIFVKNHSDGEKILRILSEILAQFGMKLNSGKTKGSNDIITQSIKKDKTSWLRINTSPKNQQKLLLLIRSHSIEYQNSGSLLKNLKEFDEILEKEGIFIENNIPQLTAITTDIAFNNPKSIPLCCSIISKLLNNINDIDKKDELVKRVYDKLINMPNSGFAQIWLQRMLKYKYHEFIFNEKICNLNQENIKSL
ncbi:RNA-directed DNA polymerase [Mannheimia massilioguelmaensis]|uniref:RNA-directed DNA polymerase n=1 Tax=Mannheimia massilioguelmaensis TaxID=1604354 RepID=UPI000B278AC5|nr:RNA-directed DNA polymerase [Mannheimia massilioguelmaensis]